MSLYFFIGLPSNNSKSQRYRLQFDIKPFSAKEQVAAAEVRITMLYNTRLKTDEMIRVLMHDIVKPGKKGFSKPILR